MRSKIKFFFSIRWKLLLYYLIIILLTAGIFQYISINIFRKAFLEERIAEMENQLTRFSMDLASQCSKDCTDKQMIKYFQQITKSSGMPVQLYNAKGQFITKSRGKGPVFRGVEDAALNDEELSKLKQGMKFSFTTKRDSKQKPLEKREPAPGRPGKRMDHQRDYRKMMTFVSPIKKKNQLLGSLVSSMPMSPPGHVERMILDSFLIAVVVSSLVSLFLANSFTKPIRKMEEAARCMAKGDFSHKMHLNRKDELGYLADAFDEMSFRLKKNIENRMRLMGDISHELNTPLTTIQASTEVMYDDMVTTDEERKKYLKSILNQAKRLSYLIDDITELSKFEAGMVKINKMAFEAVDPVKRAVESAGFLAKRKGMTINTTIEDENIKAFGDPDRILQTIQNLVNNAVHHNSRGTSINVSVVKEDDKVLFSVEDDGKGIPEDELESIFQRFHKVDKSRTSGDSGSGLGLAIIKEILEAHGEEIQVTSSSKGSKFFFYLPSV